MGENEPRVNRRDGTALMGIVVGAVVSVLVTAFMLIGIGDEARPAPTSHPAFSFSFAFDRPAVDFAVIRMGPGLDGPSVRMSGPEAPATGWHRPRFRHH